MNIIYLIIIVLIAWTIWGYMSSKVETTNYSVLKIMSDYEIRLYPKHIVAQTIVGGNYNQAINQGFRILAGYIFGGNISKTSIAMTAPVTEQKNINEKIAMTAPVVASIEGNSHVITFGMPSTYTLETLPTPNDSKIQIVELPEKKFAVINFSGYRSENRTIDKKQTLIDSLKRDKIEIIGEPVYAGYNAPWTPPWMTRNEVLIEIK